MEDTNIKLADKMENLLNLFTQQFVALQNVVMNSQAETRATLHALNQAMSQLSMNNQFAAAYSMQMQQQQLQLQQQSIAQRMQVPPPQLIQQPIPTVKNEIPNTKQVAPPAQHNIPKPDTPPVLQPQVPTAPKAVPEPKDSFGDKFKKKEGEWDCGACYVRCSAEKNICPCCNTPRGGSEAPTTNPAPAFKPTQFVAPAATGFSFGANKESPINPPSTKSTPQPVKSQFSFKSEAPPGSNKSANSTKAEEKPTLIGGGLNSSSTNSPMTFSFKPQNPAGSNTPAKSLTDEKPSIFGGGLNSSSANSPMTFSFKPQNPVGSNTPVNSSNEAKPSLFGGGSSNVNFGDLKTKNSFLSGKDNSNAFKVDPKQHQLFQTPPAKVQQADDTDDAPEAYNPDDSLFIRPNIALPDLVDVKTGEENEEVLFCSRAKLYRFYTDTKEVKERGAGEIKLLKHKETKQIRCVMRREQVHKVCANFSIKAVKATFKKDKKNTLVWNCLDYSDRDEHPEGENITLICRFKGEPESANFKKIIDDNQE